MENTRDGLLALIRQGKPMTFGQQLRLTVVLSMPAIVAQLSTIVMQYIDASMVGSLGAEASASIGLVTSSTWLFWGMCSAMATGYSVQVANRIGANDYQGAQALLKQSVIPALMFSVALCLIGVAISGRLPYWLGAKGSIVGPASTYFMLFALSLPMLQLNYLASGILRCSGNTLFPGLVNVGMCVLDVVFNLMLIFPSRYVDVCGLRLFLPGADMGVAGAAVGTASAALVAGLVMILYLYFGNKELNLKGCTATLMISRARIVRAFRISLPLFAERVLFCGAQIMQTVIVAPLGGIAIAANAFAITAESICYMPGFGISDAATTLVGQSLGAGRRPLARKFAYITVGSGIVVMTIGGVIMYLAAPLMMGIITPVVEIVEAGVEVLRIEAFAEPMYAASIVSFGVFVGAGDTLVPSCMNLGSIWLVRITLAALLAPIMGLKGVWLAMTIELCFRGVIFLWRLKSDRWMRLENFAQK